MSGFYKTEAIEVTEKVGSDVAFKTYPDNGAELIMGVLRNDQRFKDAAPLLRRLNDPATRAVIIKSATDHVYGDIPAEIDSLTRIFDRVADGMDRIDPMHALMSAQSNIYNIASHTFPGGKDVPADKISAALITALSKTISLLDTKSFNLDPESLDFKMGMSALSWDVEDVLAGLKGVIDTECPYTISIGKWSSNRVTGWHYHEGIPKDDPNRIAVARTLSGVGMRVAVPSDIKDSRVNAFTQCAGPSLCVLDWTKPPYASNANITRDTWAYMIGGYALNRG